MFLGIIAGNVWITVVEFFGGEVRRDEGAKRLVMAGIETEEMKVIKKGKTMSFVTGGDKIGDKDFVGSRLLQSFDNAGG